MEWLEKRTFCVLVENDAGEGEGDVNQGGNCERNDQSLLETVRFLHAALGIRQECMSYARAQSYKGYTHREADYAEHVRDLHVFARPEHGKLEAGLIVQNTVDNNDDHHSDQDVVSSLGSKRDGTADEIRSKSIPHGTEEDDGIDAQGKHSSPE